MDIVNGMPAHALLLHFVVVLAPLTALLEIVCSLWPAARRGQLMWLTLILAIVTMVLTPITINAGQWLYDQRAAATPILNEHAARGSVMIYFAVALLVIAIMMVGLRIVERRSEKRHLAAQVLVAIVVLAVGISSMIQIYRVGDAGTRSVWGSELPHLEKAHGG